MNEKNIDELKKNIVAIGRLLWEKDLTAGLSGNLSLRLDEQSFLITATRTCLGLLKEDDIVRLHVTGECEDPDSKPSTEWKLHADVYQAFSTVQAVMHVHALHTNAFFLRNDELKPEILEARHVLGRVPVIPQQTINVEDTAPVIETLKNSSIVVLRRHGSLAVGSNLFECFILLQALEEAVKTDIITRVYSNRSF